MTILHKKIPSPEEISEVLRAREAGVDVVAIKKTLGMQVRREVVELDDKMAQMERQVQALQSRAKRGKTPAEVRESLDKCLGDHNMEPVEELVRMVMAKNTDGRFLMDTPLRVKVLSDLCEYRLPRLKNVEISGNVDMRHEIIIVRYGDDGQVRRERNITPIVVPLQAGATREDPGNE